MKLSKELQNVFRTKDVNPENITFNISIPGEPVPLQCVKEIVDLYPHLTTLDINTTEIDDEALTEIGKLTDLEFLDISGNSLITNKGIAKLTNLKKLKFLDVSVNSVDDGCIDYIIQLPLLEKLLISATRISVFCLYKLSVLKNLTLLDLVRCLAGEKLPPQLVKKKSAVEILNFIKSKEQGTIPFGNIRLLLLGEPGSGKTSICQVLTGNMDQETATLGISINNMTSDLIGKEYSDMNINVWDFGGQDEQLYVHQVFFTKNCIFTIVIEPRSNDGIKAFARWYSAIREYWSPMNGKDQFPLFIVFSKFDDSPGGLGDAISEHLVDNLKQNILSYIQEEGKLNENQMKNLNVKFIRTSVKKENGLATYLDEIHKSFNELVQGANAIDSIKVSPTVNILSKKIHNQKKDNSYFLSMEALETLYDQIDIDEKEDLSSALNSLHYFGDLYYSEGYDFVFINPKEIASLIYEMLFSSKINNKFREEGISRFDRITPKLFANMYLKDVEDNKLIADNLLDYLCQKQLIINVSSSNRYNKTYAIPPKTEFMSKRMLYQEIGKQENNRKLNLESGRHFVYKMPDTKKSRVIQMTSIICNTLMLFRSSKINSIEVFNNALVIQTTMSALEEKAIIRENEEDKTIELWISNGPIWQKGYLFDVIDDAVKNLLKINSTHSILFAVCPCNGRLENECSYKHNAKILEERSRADANFYIKCVSSQKCMYVPEFLTYNDMIDKHPVQSEESDAPETDLFVIMPFDERNETSSKKNGNKYDKMYNSIRDAIHEANIEICKHTHQNNFYNEDNPLIRADGLKTKNLNIDEAIRKGIEKARIIIGILEENRANCYFEVGYAHAFQNKYLLLFKPEGQQVSFDVEHLTIHEYKTNDDYNNFKNLLIENLVDYWEQKTNLESPQN